MTHRFVKRAAVSARRLCAGMVISAIAVASPSVAQDRRSADPVAVAMATERSLDDLLTRDPKRGVLFSGIRAVFPQEYRQFLTNWVNNPEAVDEEINAVFAPLTEIISEHDRGVLKAPNASLVILAEKRLALLRAARSDSAALCSELASDLDYSDMTLASRRTRTIMTEYVVAILEAGRAGLERPVEHGPTADADLTALGEAIVGGGASQRVIDQIYGDRAPDSAKDNCAAAITLYEAMGRLPARQMAAVMLSMLRATEGATGDDNAVDTAIADSPLSEPFLATFKADFPEEYANFRAEQAKLIEDGGDPEDVDGNLYRLAVALSLEHSAGIARAGESELSDLLRRRQDALRLFKAEDVALCASFAETYFYTTSDDTPDEAIGQLIAFEVAYFRAIASGLRRPVTRPDLDKADLDALTARLQKTGLSDQSLSHLVSGDMDELVESQRCDMAIALHEAVAAMPIQTRVTLVARMMGQLSTEAPDDQ